MCSSETGWSVSVDRSLGVVDLSLCFDYKERRKCQALQETKRLLENDPRCISRKK